jgi:hypothetical protein
MKKKYLMISIGLLLLGGQSCKDEDETPKTRTINTSTGILTDGDKVKLYNKIWYPTSTSGGVNFEFITNGNVLRFNKSLNGSWAWINNGDTMNVTGWMGDKYKLLIVSVTDKTMSFKSNQGGSNFETLSSYRDTE